MLGHFRFVWTRTRSSPVTFIVSGRLILNSRIVDEIHTNVTLAFALDPLGCSDNVIREYVARHKRRGGRWSEKEFVKEFDPLSDYMVYKKRIQQLYMEKGLNDLVENVDEEICVCMRERIPVIALWKKYISLCEKYDAHVLPFYSRYLRFGHQLIVHL